MHRDQLSDHRDVVRRRVTVHGSLRAPRPATLPRKSQHLQTHSNRQRCGEGQLAPPARERLRRIAHLLRAPCRTLILAVIMTSAASTLTAAPRGPEEKTERTLFVPRDDLPLLLGGQNERVLMTRAEYRQLEALARRQPSIHAPVPVVLTSADYRASIDAGMATIEGRLTVEVLEPGLHKLPLRLGGVWLRKATLDDANAAIGQSANGQLVLLVRGVGQRRLTLELQAPVAIEAAQQSLNCQLPHGGSTSLSLDVPGDVTIKSGVQAASRRFDAAANRTRFELLCNRGPLALVMSLNNRRLRQDRVVVARSLVAAELTTTYERLHATVSFDVLHGAVDELLLEVPAEFHVTKVSSPLLSQWVIRREETGDLLAIKLREPTRSTEVVHVAAIRTPVEIGAWTMPQLAARDVASQVTVVGLLAETRLRPLGFQPHNLIAIDNTILQTALPSSILQAEPGAPQVRPLVAYYAPASDFRLTATLEDPPDEMRLAMHLLLSLDEQQQTLHGGFTLTPQATKRRSFTFRLPRQWQLESIRTSKDAPLTCDRYQADAETRYVVRLPQAIAPGTSQTIYFDATYSSSAWLDDWQTTDVDFPTVQVEQATVSSGAIAVEAAGDLSARPATTQGLTPLDSSQRSRYGIEQEGTDLSYAFKSADFKAQFQVERVQPRLSARNYSFFHVRDGALTAHYEIVYLIDRAHARKLAFQLPASTPTTLSVRGLDGLKLKETAHTTAAGERRWEVLLAKAQQGTARIAIDFEQQLDDDQAKELVLPLIRAADVDYQTQMAAVEGDSSLSIKITTAMRPVDIGELAEADYTPGRRLLGAYASTADGDQVQISTVPRDVAALPSAIVQRAELVTLLSARGESQSAARYLLRTKVPFVAVELPPGAQLWSASLDGKPIKPRRRGKRILLSLQTDTPGQDRDLQIVYQMHLPGTSWVGRVATAAPRLSLLATEQDDGVPVPQADLIWRVHLPAGFRIADSAGTVFPVEAIEPRSPLAALGSAVLVAGGGALSPYARVAQARATASFSRANVAADGADVESDEAAMPVLPQDAFSSGVRDRLALPPTDQPALRRRTRTDSYGDTKLRDASTDFLRRAKEGKQAANGVPAAAAKRPARQPGGPASGVSAGGMASAPATTEPEDVALSADGERLAGEGQAAAHAATRQPYSPDSSRKGTKLGKHWALQGLRGLQIQIDPSSPDVTFRSLGAEPLLQMTIFHQDRMTWLAWAVALVVLGVGLLMTRSSLVTRFLLLAGVAIVACGLPLLGGPATALAGVCDKALQAVFGLLFLWVVIGFFGLLCRAAAKWLTPAVAMGTGTLVVAGICLVSASGPAMAQDLPALLRPLLQPPKPVRIPDDAIVIPFDPDNVAGRSEATQVFVPYSRYVDLWNRAHPERKMGAGQRAPRFSLAGAHYDVVLSDAEHLTLEGYVDIELFTDGPVDVPLALRDAVITTARIGGKPARLKAVQPNRPVPVSTRPATQAQQVPQPQQQRAAPRPPAAILTLVAEGKGRHRLELTVQIAVTRRGGWRIARGTLPHATATAIRVTVPEAQTDVRRTLGKATLDEITQEDAQAIESVLGANGRFDWQWRGKVAAGAVDHSLTAESAAVVDFRADGVRVVWQLDLDFGQTERNRLELAIPAGNLLEKVEGKNVRGWDVTRQAAASRLQIELLKPVKGHEQIAVHLSRRTPLAVPHPTAIDVPIVTVPGAALHRGVVWIRRSPILELKTTASSGVVRTDASAAVKTLATAASSGQSPLGVRPYQAFRFSATPFRIAVVAAEIEPHLAARLRTVLRIGETEAALESEIQITPQRRHVHDLHLKIPADLDLKQVTAAGLSDWSISAEGGTRVLNVYFATGQSGEFALSVRGELSGHTAADATVPLPQLEVLDVAQQQGTLVVQVDPSLDARLVDLVACRPALLDRARTWLSNAQRPSARLAVDYRGTGYRGAVHVTPRTPRITCNTFTNVRLTMREVEETVLLDLQIEDAGVRRIVFQLPTWLKDAQINAPMIRQKTVRPVEGQERVEVTLDLQDAITGQYRVMIENDRALRPGRQLAPLPIVTTGTTHSRYVTLENAGRDEVVVDGLQGFAPVNRQSRQWQLLATRLGSGNFATAYVNSTVAADTEFGYKTRRREIIETAGATIGLARTTLVLDGNGAYRGTLLMNVDNRTEPYLEIQLPTSASLWTAHVADQPVKPARSAAAKDRQQLRIPLVKTAEGDLDYSVVLKYGGSLDRFALLRTVQFPLIQTVNINVEQSQIKLVLPTTQNWYRFDGTATQVAGEDDFVAGYVAYRTDQIESLTQVLRGSNYFSQMRASDNITNLQTEIGQEIAQLKRSTGRRASSAKLRYNLDLNERAFQNAAEQVQQLSRTEGRKEEDNRKRLDMFYERQSNTLSTNSVIKLGSNFGVPSSPPGAAPQAGQSGQTDGRFDARWLSHSGLAGLQPREEGEIIDKSGARQQGEKGGRIMRGELGRPGAQAANAPIDQDAAQNVFGYGERGRAAGKTKPQRGTGRGGSQRELGEAYAKKIQSRATNKREVAQQQTEVKQRVAAGIETTTGASSASGPVAPPLTPPAPTAAAVPTAGLVSLDVEFPERGTAYYFTTPRGAVEITARPVDRRLVDRSANLVWLLVIAAVLAMVFYVARRLAHLRGVQIFAAVAISGIGFLLMSIVPLMGLVMLLGSILIAVDATTRRPAAVTVV
jgi:hypothetical protein